MPYIYDCQQLAEYHQEDVVAQRGDCMNGASTVQVPQSAMVIRQEVTSPHSLAIQQDHASQPIHPTVAISPFTGKAIVPIPQAEPYRPHANLDILLRPTHSNNLRACPARSKYVAQSELDSLMSGLEGIKVDFDERKNDLEVRHMVKTKYESVLAAFDSKFTIEDYRDAAVQQTLFFFSFDDSHMQLTTLAIRWSCSVDQAALDVNHVVIKLKARHHQECADLLNELEFVCLADQVEAYAFEQQVKDMKEDGYCKEQYLDLGSKYFRGMQERAVAGIEEALRIQGEMVSLLKHIPELDEEMMAMNGEGDRWSMLFKRMAGIHYGRESAFEYDAEDWQM